MKKRTEAIIDSLERQGIDVAGISARMEEKLSGVQLRFDRVALRFIDDVQAALQGLVPTGKTLVFTITAPLRLVSKTATALEESVRAALATRSATLAFKEAINGNQIRVRLMKGVSRGAGVIGFVHNPDCDPEILFETTQGLLELARAPGKSRRPTPS